jgi:hypothetical protein
MPRRVQDSFEATNTTAGENGSVRGGAGAAERLGGVPIPRSNGGSQRGGSAALDILTGVALPNLAPALLLRLSYCMHARLQVVRLTSAQCENSLRLWCRCLCLEGWRHAGGDRMSELPM